MNMRLISALLLSICLPAKGGAFECTPGEVLPENAFPVVRFSTSMGDFEVELNRMRAPATVNNFLYYAVNGHYEGTIFHRVMSGFVVQGGGYDAEFNEISLREPVMNESGNGLNNNAGTIAMARFDDPHSATSQFFINMANNESLNPSSRNWGYTVFGDVISGLEVLQAIAAVDTGFNAEVDFQDVPLIPVVLNKVTIQ